MGEGGKAQKIPFVSFKKYFLKIAFLFSVWIDQGIILEFFIVLMAYSIYWETEALRY